MVSAVTFDSPLLLFGNCPSAFSSLEPGVFFSSGIVFSVSVSWLSSLTISLLETTDPSSDGRTISYSSSAISSSTASGLISYDFILKK